VAGGNWGRLGAPQQHRQPLVQPTTPDSTDLETSTKLGATSTCLVEIKYFEDTRPWNQRLNVAKEQHKDLCNIPRSLRYSPHHPFECGLHHLQHSLWSLSRNWVLILKKSRSLPPSSTCTLWTLLLNLSIPDVPFPVLLSILIRSRFQAKHATLLIPIDFPFFFAVEELYGIYGTWYQSGSFSLIKVGSGVHCLCSFSFLFFSCFAYTA